jgi:hypothetical protein
MDVRPPKATIAINMKDKPRSMDDTLLAAWRATSYRVQAPGAELKLRIDQHDAQLAKLLREAWVECAALLTAWNPGSRPQSRERNEASQDALLRELRDAGYPCLSGINEPENAADSATAWIEPSVLVLDLPLDVARAIAARYGQLAFLWIDQQATPRLVRTADETC